MSDMATILNYAAKAVLEKRLGVKPTDAKFQAHVNTVVEEERQEEIEEAIRLLRDNGYTVEKT